MKKPTYKNCIMTFDRAKMTAFTERWGEGVTEAVIRDCKKNRCTYEQFLINFISDYADDEFFDYLSDLCDKYHIEMFSEEELEGLAW